MTTAPSDWNASDAEKDVARGGLLARLPLGSTRSHTRRALKDAGAELLKEGSHPRVRNLVDGLAARMRLGPIDIWLFAGGPNALSGRIDRPVVGVSVGLLDTYTRTELEAVVAHCLVRHHDAGRRGIHVGYADDVRAAALTKYPPALADAIRKADAYRGRYAPFYLVAEGPSHRSAEERIAALLDL